MLRFLPSRGHVDVLPFINSWITRGSIITTDCLATYNILNSMGFQHYRVNHSRHLVAPDGTNTNRIERIFGSVKRMVRLYNYQYINPTNLNLILSEWCFRYCYKGWDRRYAFLKILFVLKIVRTFYN